MKLMFDKQFGVREGHSTKNTLLEFLSKICNSFNQKIYISGALIQLSISF